MRNFAAALRSEEPFVMLFEGVTAAWKALEVGCPAVASFGHLSDGQAEKLKNLNKEVGLAFANPESIRVARERLLSKAVPFRYLRFPWRGMDLGQVPAEEWLRWRSQSLNVLSAG